MPFSLSQSSSIPTYLKGKKSKTLQAKSNKSANQTLGRKKRKAGVFTSCASASLTVEASMVMTIFILISYCILYPFFVLNIHMKLQAVTECVVQRESGYEHDAQTNWEMLLRESIDLYSIKNIDYQDSICIDENGIIDLIVQYQIAFPFPVNHVENFIVRSRKRAWTSIDKDSDGNSADTDSQYVYVTSNAKVYHLYMDCTHLKLSIHSVEYEQLKTLRNASGGIYYACERCYPKNSRTVYVTDEGDRYHGSLSCSGLKRQIQKVSKDTVTGMSVCSRCQARFAVK